MSALYLLSSQICETNVLICTINFLTMAPVTCFCFAYRLICSSLYYLHLWRLIINTCFGFDFATVTKKPKLPTSSQVVSCKMQTLYSILKKQRHLWYIPFRDKVCCRYHYVISGLHNDRDFTATRRLQNPW